MALALLPADRILAAEHAGLAPLAPEGASSSGCRDTSHAPDLAARQGVRATDLAAQGIIDRVRAKDPAATVIITGMMIPPSMGQDYAREFAAIYPELAKENHLPFIPFLLDGVGGSEELNQADRIHPTARGHAILAETVWKVLRPLL